jgi:hypothetical protein
MPPLGSERRGEIIAYRKSQMKPIPAIWRIDVEPDEIPSSSDCFSWNGFIAMDGLVKQLRPLLEDRSGCAVHPTWLLRLDPEIGRSFGQVDFVVARYRGLVDEIIAHGDPLGIHVHYYRWDEQRQIGYSDHADVAWIAHCFNVAAKTFERCFGEPVRRASQGGYFLHDAVVDCAIAAGVEVDVTAEPGLGPLSDDRSFGAYATAPSPDFRNYPRRPYYPSRDALDAPASSSAAARPMMIVPLTAYDYQTALTPWHRRIAKRVVRRPRQHLPLNPFKTWSDPKTYWDLVERAADEGPARYIAFAVRTDAPGSRTHRIVQALLEYLPSHPIARRLRFVDPLSSEIRALASEGMGGIGR